MRKLNIIIISLLILITIYTAISKPVLHKHFIIAPEKFKLASVNQTPQDNQSTTLFKLFETNEEQYIEEKSAKDVDSSNIDNEKISSDVTIIPSSLSYLTQTTINNQSSNLYAQQDQEKLELSNRINSETMQKADKLREEKRKKELRAREIEQAQQLAKNRQRELSNKSRRPNIPNNKNSDIENNSCPVCSGLKDLFNGQSREEIIAWNIWRSQIQNKIMDTSNVNAEYGALYTFTFNVDNQGNISNIDVRTNSRNKESKDNVYRAIQRLERTPILKFPENTKRSKVNFTGGFMLSTYTQYSTPADYNDYERIIRTNP